MKRYPMKSILAFVFILFSFYSCKKHYSDPRVVLDREYKNEIIAGRKAMSIYLMTNAPGASVSVSIDGKTVWSEGLGYANKELKAPARPATKYRIGQSSKMFAAMLIAKLQEEGKLNVDSSFYTYIPDFPKKQWDFSVSDLGTNSAGFPETHLEALLNKNNYKDLKEYVHATENDSLAYPPNAYFATSDYGTCLLGVVAETLYQKSYPKLVQHMLLDTLGLKETVLDSPSYLIDNRSSSYYQNFIAQIINAPEIDSRFMAPAYGYLSTADDLNKLGQIVLNKTFFSETSYELFLTPRKLNNGYESNFGFGWSVFTDRDGRKVYIQQGNSIGGSSFLAIFPELKLVVSLCTNLADNSGSLPAGKITQLFLDKLDPKKPAEAPAEKKQAKKQDEKK